MAAGVNRGLMVLEFFVILVAICLWWNELAENRVHFWCNDVTMVQVSNSFTSKSPQVKSLVYAFTLCCLKPNIFFLTGHMVRVDNEVVDCLRNR